MNNPSDPTDAPAPKPPAGDHAWLQSLLFADGSQLIDYGDGLLLVEAPPAYGKKKGGDVLDPVNS
jgi:hypothetical protein